MSVPNMDVYLNRTTISVFTLTVHWLVYLNSSINPVIYNFMSCELSSLSDVTSHIRLNST